MLLFELGDRDFKKTVLTSSRTELKITGEIAGRKITFTASMTRNIEEKHWIVYFVEHVYDKEKDRWTSTVELTGSGGEFGVLSFIMTCMKELLKKNPITITFNASKGAESNSRANIYKRLADKILPDYESSTRDMGDVVYFEYTKNID